MENAAQRTDTEFIESSGDELEDIIEPECIPVSVKLVDCKRFPWYFKKYKEQLSISPDIYDLVSDNEEENNKHQIVKNGSNCGISDSMFNCSNIRLSKAPTVICKITPSNREEIIKRREDIEVQLALSRRSLNIVDYKRNIGLVGMTITQRIINDVGADSTIKEKDQKAKKNDVANTCYIQAADRTLSSCGTELIRIPEVTENNIVPKVTEYKNNFEGNNGKGLNKIRLQSYFDEGAEKLLYHIIGNKTQNKSGSKSSKRKYKQKIPKHKRENMSSHVMKPKKSKKYKKKQIKDGPKALLNYKDTELTKDGMDQTDAVNQKPTKDTEPHSPILLCKTLKKNRDYGDVLFKEFKSDNNATVIKMGSNISQENRYQSKTESSIDNLILNGNQFKHTMSSKQHAYQNIPQVNDVGTKKAFQDNYENGNHATNNDSHNLSNIPENSATDGSPSGDSYDMQLQIVSVMSLADNSKLNSNTNVINKTHETPNIESAQSRQISVISHPNRPMRLNNTCNVNPSVRNVSNSNDVNKKSSPNMGKNNNMPAHNNYALAVMSRPSQPSNIQGPRFCQPTSNDQNSSRMPLLVQQLSLPNSYSTNCHSGSYFGMDQRYIPRFANPAGPSYRFPPPPEKKYQPRCSPSQIPPYSWQHSNMYNKKPPKSAWTPKIYPCSFSGIVSQSPHNNLNTKLGVTPQLNNMYPPRIPPPNNIPLPASEPQSDNCSVICRNKDNFLKKCNVSTKPFPKISEKQVINNGSTDPNEEKSEGITSKIRMTEALENAVKYIKREVIESEAKTMKKESIKASTKPKITVNPITANENSQQIEQEKGYSPPILPIPTYENIMSHVSTTLQRRDGLTTKKLSSEMESTDTCDKTVPCHKMNNSAKKEEARKISLEEYKKRTHKKDKKSEISHKKIKYNEFGRKQNNKGNVDRFSTESDLGYDSDSTVIL